MNTQRVNDSKFQLAAAVFADALADPQATKQSIWNASWGLINHLSSTGDISGAQLFWHRLITGLNNITE